ncbi:hypothetical protein [Flavobacterium tyrosinilyticum]|uniref:hypothetical protein n=1 Tax=Flavobacterium tyrosinilyticum TaxID=1658740 RepID=UPI00202FE13D|nr:hypothetical protein [Flavobacterium tyrosinilyticum]MCM0665580.1 hypothetical protein [Flavobacterium tyrosinilyticum]
MSMEHKSFLFNTSAFTKELSEIILTAGETDNEKLLISFINQNLNDLKSPYSGEELTVEWIEELETEDIQELADFAMTKYYNPDEELGLSYSWELLLESFDELDLKFNNEYYILGKSLDSEKFTLDPGRMGLGFIDSQQISSIHKELISLKQNFINIFETESLDKEVIQAYEELIEIYEEAKESNCGLLMTF